MPPEAYALVTLFAVASVILGVLAWAAVRALVPPARLRSRGAATAAVIMPILAAFLALYLVGHRFGISIGPEIPLFGFQVALLGDLLIGFAAALAAASVQGLAVSLARNRTA
jgi:hypothetical protein